MATSRKSFRQAVTAHREAHGLLQAVRALLLARDTGPARGEHEVASVPDQQRLSRELSRVAGTLLPGWLGADWTELQRLRPPIGTDADPAAGAAVRVGLAQALPDQEQASFPLAVPLIGHGHLVIDQDGRHREVQALLRGVLVRLLAAHPAGTLQVLPVDGAALGAAFAPLRALVPAGVMAGTATDVEGLRAFLTQAEEQVHRVQQAQLTDPDILLLVAASLPAGVTRTERSRLSALAHAGPHGRVHLVLAAGCTDDTFDSANVTVLTPDPSLPGHYRVSDPPGHPYSQTGRGISVPVQLDPPPPDPVLELVTGTVATRAGDSGAISLADLMPAQIWQHTSEAGVSTVVGRSGREPVTVSLDDVTPHWLVGGRTGSGKTMFLLNVLYGLAARYSPDELALFLLDFKEGVSFQDFVPSEHDQSWVPHARTVGIESDREYGVAVLRELTREMQRRAGLMKSVGASSLQQLRRGRGDLALPRIVAVVDEFHVLFSGAEQTAADAAHLIEEIARAGRSYGVHLILASQSISGIEALAVRSRAVFAQFALRVALSGGGGVLEGGNRGADSLVVGQAVINGLAGAVSGNQVISFPAADPATTSMMRHRLWSMRPPGAAAPAAFIGYAEYSLEHDPTYLRLLPGARRPKALLGRAVDVGLPATGFTLERAPGRHLSVVGPSAVGADVLHAAALSLAQQYHPGQATFLLAALAAVADDVVDQTHAGLQQAGQVSEVVDALALGEHLARLAARVDAHPGAARDGGPTLLVLFGADAAAGTLRATASGATTGSGGAVGAPARPARRTGLDDLRAVLRRGPLHDVHVLGWWRGFRRLVDDLGVDGRDDIAGFVALNIRSQEFAAHVGQFGLDWEPRENRVLYLDRHEPGSQLLVPFVRPGRYAPVLDAGPRARPSAGGVGDE